MDQKRVGKKRRSSRKSDTLELNKPKSCRISAPNDEDIIVLDDDEQLQNSSQIDTLDEDEIIEIDQQANPAPSTSITREEKIGELLNTRNFIIVQV